MADVNGEKSTGGNLTGVLSPVHPVYKIDETLTKGGYAADAKATGDALAGKAPASHVSNKSNPHGVTPAQIGAAPSGYGWGAAESISAPHGDPDEVNKTCLFSCSQGNIPGEGVWRGVAHFQSEQNGQMTVRSYTGGAGRIATRYKIDGVWQPWEWVTPWLTPGVEYRTTELWNGKAVYTKVIECGNLPNNTRKQIAIGTSVSKALRCIGTRNDGEMIPMYYDGKEVVLYASKGNIHITTNFDSSATTANVQVWYTKD